MEYLKLANVTASVTAGDLTKAAVVASVTSGVTNVVNLKGRILTADELTSHLEGRVDGETVVRR